MRARHFVSNPKSCPAASFFLHTGYSTPLLFFLMIAGGGSNLRHRCFISYFVLFFSDFGLKDENKY